MTKPPEENPFNLDAPTLVRMVSGSGKLIGSVLGGQYKIVEVIGEGGIGVVYRATQLTVDRDVAIKILKKQFANDELAARRFENEAMAIGKLRHPNTLRLYDCQRTPTGELYIVTELLAGSPLADVLRDQGRLSIERAVRTLDEVCRSLSEAHSAGIVHRDLKPANIFLDRIGNEDVVKVLDFGIAKILQGSGGLTRAGAVPGTPHYMSPEQAAAQKIDHRADIYSLGVILYQMIAGKPPFDGTSVMDILKKHITDPPPPFAETIPDVRVPEDLEQVTRWMLEKTPEDRPQSVDEIRRHLPSILAIAAPPARRPTIPARPGQTIEVPVAEVAAGLEGEAVASGNTTDPGLAEDPSSLVTGSDAETGSDATLEDELVAASPTAASDAPRMRFSRLRKWSMITGAVGILLGIAIGYASMRRDEIVIPPKNEAVPVKRVAEAVEVAVPPVASVVSSTGAVVASAGVVRAEPVRAKITSEPEGAVVIAPDGGQVGVTPLEIALTGVKTYVVVGARGASGSVRLDAAKDGGRTVKVVLDEPKPAKKKKAQPATKKRGR